VNRFWTLGPNWPKGGEIDILEGVNEQTNNGMTLHTSPGCQIGSDTTQFSGSVTTGNCDVNAEGQSKNVGCSIESSSKQSYGAGLNKIGGGVYATQWNSDGINIYFFPRNAIPEDVLGANPNPSAWGKPAAKFAGACDIDKMFAEQQIVIDTTFCGQWAGAVWEDGSCAKKAKTCDEYVRDNPQAFSEAYWDIKGLKVFQDDGKAPAAVPSVPAIPTKSATVSVPAPVSTINSSLPTIPSSASSQAALPIPSSKLIPGEAPKPTTALAAPLSSSIAAVPGVPSKPVTAPALPLPSSVAAAPGLPSSSPQSTPTQNTPGAAKPSRTQSQASAPTGANGLPGWQWPIAGDDQAGEKPAGTTPIPSSPKISDAPAQNTSVAVKVPTSRQAIIQPSDAPATPPQPSNAPPAAPIVPAAPNPSPVRTVYETVYRTVTADPVATPGPDAKKARMARHVKQHRRMWTKHNVRA
jgi:hypothetical protein